MDDSLENNTNQKDRVIKHFETNKKYYLFLIIGIIVTIFIFLSLKIYNENKNNVIANKYIYTKFAFEFYKIKKPREIYEEIILVKINFIQYFLNKILEENLEKINFKLLLIFRKYQIQIFKDLIYFRKSSILN